VVADYFGIAFLRVLHGIAGTWAEAAVTALTAGVDVELPTVKTFGAPLIEAVTGGLVDEAVIDRALRRVLKQKVELGLLDPDWSAVPTVLADRDLEIVDELRGTVDLDTASNRAIAKAVAEQSIVLLSNDGTLPLASPERIALIGPNADVPMAVLGCYSFPAHVGVRHPELPVGLGLPTLAESLRAEFGSSQIQLVLGTSVEGGETDFDEAIAAALEADLVIVALGDRAGLFGRGTSGEGCDAQSLRLPGAQQDLLDAVLATGTPTVVTLLAGRPYALGTAPVQAAAIVQSFFPGEEGTPAIAGVLSGRVNPSGRLPVSVPSHPGPQPATYLAAPLARKNRVSNIDPSAAFPFGHGLGYTSFEWFDRGASQGSVPTDGAATLAMAIKNVGSRAGTEVVQLYLHDPHASVVRPVQRLIGYARVELEPGAETIVSATVPADLAAFTGRAGTRIVETGEIVLGFGRSSSDVPIAHTFTLVGQTRTVDHNRALHATFTRS
jgi:beta-xylosidase